MNRPSWVPQRLNTAAPNQSQPCAPPAFTPPRMATLSLPLHRPDTPEPSVPPCPHITKPCAFALKISSPCLLHFADTSCQNTESSLLPALSTHSWPPPTSNSSVPPPPRSSNPMWLPSGLGMRAELLAVGTWRWWSGPSASRRPLLPFPWLQPRRASLPLLSFAPSCHMASTCVSTLLGVRSPLARLSCLPFTVWFSVARP